MWLNVWTNMSSKNCGHEIKKIREEKMTTQSAKKAHKINSSFSKVCSDSI